VILRSRNARQLPSEFLGHVPQFIAGVRGFQITVVNDHVLVERSRYPYPTNYDGRVVLEARCVVLPPAVWRLIHYQDHPYHMSEQEVAHYLSVQPARELRFRVRGTVIQPAAAVNEV
jgi:hypothetical protein